MIKIAEFFNSKRGITLLMGALCVIALGGLSLTSAINAGSKDKDHSTDPNQILYNAEQLLKYKTHFIGDASNVSNLLAKLPLSDYQRGLSLATESKPYGVTVNYDLSNADKLNMQQLDTILHNNALIMFALIENVDNITFNINNATETHSGYQYSRTEAEKGLNYDLWAQSKDIKLFKTFLNNLTFRLYIYPEKYTPAMSSTPGIRISAEYYSSVGNVRYFAKQGVLLTWSNVTGEVAKGVKTIEVPDGSPVYWSPINEQGQIYEGQNDTVTVSILDHQGNKLDERQITIRYDGVGFYTVDPAPGIVIGVQTQRNSKAQSSGQ